MRRVASSNGIYQANLEALLNVNQLRYASLITDLQTAVSNEITAIHQHGNSEKADEEDEA